MLSVTKLRRSSRVATVLVLALAVIAGSILVPPGSTSPLALVPAVAATGPTTVVAGDMKTSRTWGPEGSPYVLTGKLRIMPGATLTILPGTVVKLMPTPDDWMNRSGIIVWGGQLVADGTPDKPIIFTSGYDDSVGGDSNGDGSATVPQPGDWYNITFSAATREERLARARIRDEQRYRAVRRRGCGQRLRRIRIG